MIRYFADHPTAANLIMILILVAGGVSAPQLLRETFPRIDPRRLEITVPYPGARTEDVEDAICRRIADAVDGVNNVAELQCESKEGLARAVIEMVEGSNKNYQRYFYRMDSNANRIQEVEVVVSKIFKTGYN